MTGWRKSILLMVLAMGGTLPLVAPAADESAPQWSKVVRLEDGRTFVADRNIILDATFVKPETIPTDPASPNWLQTLLGSPQPHEFPLSDLTAKKQGDAQVFVTPTGTMLDARYVNYLQQVLPSNEVRLRCKGRLDPVLIVFDDEPVGVVMPMAY